MKRKRIFNFIIGLSILAHSAPNAVAQEPGADIALKAFALEKSGDFEQAAALANQALQVNPRLAPAYYVIGLINFKRKQYEAAEIHYRKALLYYPQFAPPLADLGRLKWVRDKDAEGAIALLTHSLDYAKIDETYGYRSSIYYAQKKYDLAIADLTQAIALKPNESDYYIRRGQIEYLMGSEKAAINDLTSAINLSGKGSIYAERAELYFFSNQISAAISDFQIAATKDVQYKGLAEAAQAYKLFNEDKISEAEKLTAQFPEKRSLIDNFVRGHFALMQTRWSTAGWYLEKVLADSPRFAAAYADRALLRASFDKDFKGALSDIDTALKYRKDPEYYLTRATIYLSQKNEPLALADINNVLKLDPSNKLAIRARAVLFYKSQKLAEAIAECDKLINAKPSSKDFVMRGFMLMQNKKTDEGISDFNKALTLDANYPTAYYGLAIANMEKKNNKEALEKINLAIKADPSDDRFLYFRAKIYMDKDEFNRAYVDFARLVKSDKTDVASMIGAGTANFMMLNNDVAKQYFDAALKVSPNNQSALYMRALAAKNAAKYTAVIPDCEAIAKLCANEQTGKWSKYHCFSQMMHADALMHMGKYKDSIEKCKVTLTNAGSSPAMDKDLRAAINKISSESESMIELASHTPDASSMVKAAGDYIAKSDPRARMLDGLFKHQIATKRFLFLSNNPEPRLLYYAKFAEAFLDFIDANFIKLSGAPITRVYVVENHKEFLDFVFHHFPEEHEARAAYFRAANAIVFGDEDGIEVFAHELMHKVACDNMAYLDRWAVEGISVFYEQMYGYYDGDKLVLKLGFISPTRSRILRDELTKSTLTSILQEKDVSNHEAEVGLVSFFLNSDNKFKPYLELAKLNGKGKAASLLEALYGKPVSELEASWSEFLKKLVANKDKSLRMMKSQIFASKSEFEEAEKKGFLDDAPGKNLLPEQDFSPAPPLISFDKEYEKQLSISRAICFNSKLNLD